MPVLLFGKQEVHSKRPEGKIAKNSVMALEFFEYWNAPILGENTLLLQDRR